MIRLLTETITVCAICGVVACEKDLLYVETPEEADKLNCDVGDVVCKDCATILTTDSSRSRG